MSLRPRLAPVVTVAATLAAPACNRAPDSPLSVPSADGVEIQYEVHGSGKPALVFVHGWSCDRTYWASQIAHFSRTHRVVAVDLAGHGGSGLTRSNWSMAAFGQDVAAVVEALSLDQVVLVGHSMGGPVVVEAALLLDDRVKGVVGVDTFKDLGVTYTEDQIEAMFEPFRADFRQATRDWVRTNGFLPTSDPALVTRIADDMASGPPVVGLEAGAEMWRWLSQTSGSALQSLHVPIRLINSDVGRTNVAAGQAYSPTFDAVLMSGVGHFVMMEDPDMFNRLLTDFLADLQRETYAPPNTR